MALPKKCPSCSFLKPPKLLLCPACGFKPEPKCDVVNRDGELIEFVSRHIAKSSQDRDRQRFYQELKSIRVERAYKPGWAAVQYKEKFGEWPPRTFESLPPTGPSPATYGWVRSRQIAYARARSS